MDLGLAILTAAYLEALVLSIDKKWLLAALSRRPMNTVLPF